MCLLLLACHSNPASQLANPLIQTKVTANYATAFETCREPSDRLKTVSTQAYLYQIKGLWINFGGRSTDWICYYFAPNLNRNYVIQGQEIILTQNNQQMPEPLDVNTLIDSDVLLRRLWSHSQLSFPLYALSLKGELWEIESSGMSISVDAKNGLLQVS